MAEDLAVEVGVSAAAARAAAGDSFNRGLHLPASQVGIVNFGLGL